MVGGGEATAFTFQEFLNLQDSLEDMEKAWLPWLRYSPEVYIPFMEVCFHQFSDLQGSTSKQYSLKSGSHLADIWSLRIPAFGF